MYSLPAAAEQITLTWDASGSKVAGYRVYYSRTSGQYNKQQMIDVGRATSHSIDLASNQWYFVVTAYDSKGNESAYSEETGWPEHNRSSHDKSNSFSPPTPNAKIGGSGNRSVHKQMGDYDPVSTEKGLIPPSVHRKNLK